MMVYLVTSCDGHLESPRKPSGYAYKDVSSQLGLTGRRAHPDGWGATPGSGMGLSKEEEVMIAGPHCPLLPDGMQCPEALSPAAMSPAPPREQKSILPCLPLN